MRTLPLAPVTVEAGNATRSRPATTVAPRHLADLDLAQRRAAVEALGLPSYRANQLSTHYFANGIRDVAQVTDIPVAARGLLADA
jgi:23S rRNA (adenine2503-C2)-methyltransferase